VSGSLELLLKVEGNITELFLDITDNFTLGCSGEGITTLHQVLDEEVCEITTGEIETLDGVGQGKTLINGDGVRHTVTRVEHYTRCTTRSVKGQDGLDRNVERGCIEGLEHDLSHLFTVGLGVKRGFCEKDRMFLRGNTKLIVKSVMPNLLHIVPVCDNTVLNRVLESQNTTLGLSLVTGWGCWWTKGISMVG
jgi:hypothetical protein